MADDKDGKGQSGDQKGQGKTGDAAGQDDKGEKKNAEGFTEAQQEHINSLVAEERRKEAAKAKKLQGELDALKTKGLPKDEQTEARIKQMEDKLKGYEAKDLALSICADLKIPKEEREKYVRHVTATDEEGIRDQIRKLKQDFAPQKTGTGSNPAKTGKPGKNDGINQLIRSRGRITS
jgi:hypothetical protein